MVSQKFFANCYVPCFVKQVVFRQTQKEFSLEQFVQKLLMNNRQRGFHYVSPTSIFLGKTFILFLFHYCSQIVCSAAYI